jgi:endoglycosylceramidase
MRLTLCASAVALGIAAVAGAAPSAAAPAPIPRLSHAGANLTDVAGRTVLVHGINLVYKHPPYVAPDSAAGFQARDADFLALNGINAVRLGVLFAGVMPREGVVDQGYLTQVDRIVKLLAARHIWVLIDFHQDVFNEKFKGEGFPAWAVHDDGLPFVYPGSFFGSYQTPAVQRNYDHFWNNDFRLWDYYRQAWTAVAKKWADQPYLMGYDLFNEPSAGTQTPTCATPEGCPAFDATMQKLYEHVIAGIRTVDKRNLAWFEGQFFSNAISATSFTHVDDPNVGLSWHDYACTPAFVPGGVIPGNPDCEVNEPRVMDNAAKTVAAMGAGSLLSEFGAGDDLEDLTRLTRLADQHLVGWMYWAYKDFNDPTGSPNEGLYGDDTKPSTLKNKKVDVLVHPYPQAIAGVPTSLSWDPTTKVMDATYAPRRSTGRTDVFVPSRTYPHGYVAVVTGGRVTSAPQARHLLIEADPGATSVHVIVKAGAASAPAPSVTSTNPAGSPVKGHAGLAATGLGLEAPLAALVLLMMSAVWRRKASHG